MEEAAKSSEGPNRNGVERGIRKSSMIAKIMTFNLRQNVPSDGENAWPYRVKVVADVIRSHDCDIVGIQEGLYDMLTELEAWLPEYAWVGEGREGGNQGEFNAILYKKEKWDAKDIVHFSLSAQPEQLGVKGWNAACPRMCTSVILQSKSGEELAVFNTHLDHVSDEAQQKGMELIRQRMKLLREQRDLPLVLTGDFNVYPEHAVIAGLEQDGYRNSYSVLAQEHAEVGQTVHHFLGGEAGKPIDYIFVSPQLKVDSVLIDRRKYEGRYPSDHFPVIAQVSLL